MSGGNHSNNTSIIIVWYEVASDGYRTGIGRYNFDAISINKSSNESKNTMSIRTRYVYLLLLILLNTTLVCAVNRKIVCTIWPTTYVRAVWQERHSHHLWLATDFVPHIQFDTPGALPLSSLLSPHMEMVECTHGIKGTKNAWMLWYNNWYDIRTIYFEGTIS